MKKIFFLAGLVVPLGILAAQTVLPGYQGFWDRDKRITALDILEYYPDRLPYLRNEIYARYGRSFVTRAYQDYFNQQGWYRIRSNYTDDWLSGTDKYNAELLRAMEQAPPAADTLELLLRNIEYRSASHLLTFNDREVMERDSNEGYGMYSGWGGTASSRPYFIVGDWVLTAGSSYQGRVEVYAYRLNHTTKRITTTANAYMDEKVLEPLRQARDRLLSPSR
ncbi:MAG: YARHG domain-containing protein [Treponema sp.]|jgi:hypothetical protein|nr:YARHG domain-containing protein [Treponema sp.]